MVANLIRIIIISFPCVAVLNFNIVLWLACFRLPNIFPLYLGVFFDWIFVSFHLSFSVVDLGIIFLLIVWLVDCKIVLLFFVSFPWTWMKPSSLWASLFWIEFPCFVDVSDWFCASLPLLSLLPWVLSNLVLPLFPFVFSFCDFSSLYFTYTLVVAL